LTTRKNFAVSYRKGPMLKRRRRNKPGLLRNASQSLNPFNQSRLSPNLNRPSLKHGTLPLWSMTLSSKSTNRLPFRMRMGLGCGENPRAATTMDVAHLRVLE
jgi:hypothetical protein